MSRTRTAPAGLCAIIAALQPEGYNSTFAPKTAATYRGVAEAILRAQREGADTYHEVVFRVATADYPGRHFGPTGDQCASECPDITAIAGFWADVATCWRVMNAINGKDGAR